MESTVFEAIIAGDQEAVERILRDDPAAARARREDGVSATLLALYHRQPGIASRLATAAGELDVFEAAALGRLARLTALLDEDGGRASAYSQDGWTPLHLAVFFGQFDAARLLLDRHAPVGAVGRNAMANQPIHAAAAGRHDDIVELLLDHGADPNARQAGGWTVLHQAAQNGNAVLVETLLQRGAHPAPHNDDGVTPSDLAARAGQTALAARLSGA